MIMSNNEMHLCYKVGYFGGDCACLNDYFYLQYGHLPFLFKIILRPHKAYVDLRLHVDLASLIGPW